MADCYRLPSVLEPTLKKLSAPGRIPRIRERVLVDGRDGVFLVVWVDLPRMVAVLVRIDETGALEEDVPFTAIRPLNPEPSTG